MASASIRYYDRYKKTLETEQVYGERWLRWIYESAVGKLALDALVKRALFSKWYGWRMGRAYSANLVLPFIVDYNVNTDEFEKSPFAFKSFNDFFARSLKPEARPVTPGDDVAIFPADGRHLVFPNVDAADGFYVKGVKFDIADLFGDPGSPERTAAAEKFAGGAMVISRLCPVDYHRFHFPVTGVPTDAKLVNGYLYSVSPIALSKNARYLTENKRMVTLIETPRFGTVAMIEVGATCVGTIRELYVPGRTLAKGEEKGLFRFGGSCVITIFQAGRIRFDDDLIAQSAAGVESYARMGDRLTAPDIRIVESNEDVLLYDTGHIPGAVHIDWRGDLQDNTMRDYIAPEKFAEVCSKNGITPNTMVIFYGDKSNWWAAYALWAFRLFGHTKVKLLDGGRDKWKAENRPLTREKPSYARTSYPAPAQRNDEEIRAFYADALAHSKARKPLVDVRSPGEYKGDITHMPEYPQEGVLLRLLPHRRALESHVVRAHLSPRL